MRQSFRGKAGGVAGFLQEPLGFGRIVGIGRAGGVVARDAGRQRAGGPDAPVHEQRAEQRRYVDRVIERAADPGILERASRGIDRHVVLPDHGTSLQLLAVGLLPAPGLSNGYLDNAQVARLVFGSLGQRLRDDPYAQAVGPRGAPQ